MKKIFCLLSILIFFVLPFSFACQKSPSASDIVSEVRFNVYEGVGEKTAVTSDLSFREFPLDNDMKKGVVKYCASFRLLPKDNNLEKNYKLSFSLNGLTYGDDFEIDEVSGFLTCIIIFDKKTEYDELEITVSTTDFSEKITLKSLLPKDTITYKTALEKASEVLADLFEQNRTENGINGEIRMRVIVKNGKAFWYAGYHYSDTDCVALLLDGSTGELLARRNKR